MMKNSFQIAEEIVNALVEEDGLDVGAMMHRKIEKRISEALLDERSGMKQLCLDEVSKMEDQNEFCADTNVKWIDSEETIASIKKIPLNFES